MNRKVMRKSTLISSIAMLLVAVLALSGVTFAWFSSDPVASAGSMVMQTSAASGLYICQTDVTATNTTGANWVGNLKWEGTNTLIPVSCGFENGSGSNFYKTSSSLPSGKWTDAKIESASYEGVTPNYICKKIWLKADQGFGEGKVASVTMKVTLGGDDPKNYSRFAIIDLDAKGGPKVTVFAKEDGTTDCFVSSTGETATLAHTAAGSIITLVDDFDGEPRAFEIYFYFEGQDADCYNLNSDAHAAIDLRFELGAVVDAPAEEG